MNQATLKTHDTQALDALTGGAFSASTSGERAARVREWLASDPSAELMQEVFRELSGRDKGAARLLRERLDEIKRSRGQEAIAAEWAAKAEALLSQGKLNIADAMAWQRDAAKAGAPLSREPLAALKAQLTERIRAIEDLQHRVQVQREAAVLLAQRIEVLSTKPWRDAEAAAEALRADVPEWQVQADALVQDAGWSSVDARFPPLLDASRSQLQAVWDAFRSALAQVAAAHADPLAALPPVPVWADEIRALRGVPPEAPPAKAAKAKVDPQVRAQANEAVAAALARLEQEVGQGHGKASAGAAAALRNALKEHGKLVDDKLESQAHAALAAAGELEGWQRWRTDQLRHELVAKAENLFELVPANPPAARSAAGVVRGGRPAKGARANRAAEAGSGAETIDASEAGSFAASAQADATASPNAADGTPSAHGSAPAAEFDGTAPAGGTDAEVAAVSAEAGTANTADVSSAASTSDTDTESTSDATKPASAAGPAGDTDGENSTGWARKADSVDAASGTSAADGSAIDAAAERPSAPDGVSATAPAPAASASVPLQRRPRFGGRKMQEQLRSLREQWKQLDQGGAPNHALWKRFDEACNEAYKVVEAWLEKVKSEAAEHRSRRLALVEEVRAWAAAHPGGTDTDWKAFSRAIHQFENRWRDAGHLSERAFAELQPQWKDAIGAAEAPLAQVQRHSLERRHAMIEEARALGAQPTLRIDAVKALQQRWQAEAQSVPIERKQEQKLWDAFRKPIDDAFNRKSEERERLTASLSERDRVVLEASKALEAANATGDAQKIRAAMSALDAALKGQAQARAEVQQATDAQQTGSSAPAQAAAAGDAGVQAAQGEGSDGGDAAEGGAAAEPPAAPPKPAPKPLVVARRGDDRPGMKKDEPQVPGRGGRFGDRKPGAPGGRFGDRAGPGAGRDAGRGGRFGGDRGGDRDGEDRGPRLGDVAFRAQREALDHAQQTLRKLAAQAHGEALGHLLAAWEQRQPEQVPSVGELGKAVSPAVRGSWVQALGQAPSGDAAQVLLRLEIAAEVPSPAEHLDARRMLQLQLLTRRNEPSPAQTWGQDVAQVFGTAHQPQAARRLQNVLKVLLRA
ncbi:DUF349 domain-containing protein [Ramlibacter sp. AN1015]|uniref:DUF349 domain-containing protein n=1 Tax=Ramlibacter sp. AN1015 TaxID=3133428 RepID=UPI0030C58B63